MLAKVTKNASLIVLATVVVRGLSLTGVELTLV